ncbi:hypothetical protein EDB92DRAFT_2105159 [Lactarius akahatsu]|uniref:Uncharacterized protein n=1 Tax=Lactarius akahatsu TaxID=416441 RepID=A0AAD4LAN8_9AGAM|nr:hypothetical protein EDB92DRAFT_2105159 [Lactarius akahatsu]
MGSSCNFPEGTQKHHTCNLGDATRGADTQNASGPAAQKRKRTGDPAREHCDPPLRFPIEQQWSCGSVEAPQQGYHHRARPEVWTTQAVDVQRDEGGELRREAVPDAFPTGRSGARFLTPGEGEVCVGARGQRAPEELKTGKGSGVPQDERLDGDRRLEDQVSQEERAEAGKVQRSEGQPCRGADRVVRKVWNEGGWMGGWFKMRRLRRERCQVGWRTDAEACGESIEDGCLESETDHRRRDKAIIIDWAECQVDGLEPGQQVNERKRIG